MKLVLLALVVAFALGCSSGRISVGDNRDAGLAAAGAMGEAGASGEPTVDQLLSLLDPCTRISNGLLAREVGRTKDVPVCGFGSAVYWTSQLSVDCDGKRGPVCNKTSDPQSTDTTDGKDSSGNSLDPAVVPYVEVPTASATFDYQAAGLRMGSVVAVIYKGRLVYGVLGNEQSADVIGAASHAMAEKLGIDPDPILGGLQTKDVTYLAFSGAAHAVPALEDVSAIDALGQSSVDELIATGR